MINILKNAEKTIEKLLGSDINAHIRLRLIKNKKEILEAINTVKMANNQIIFKYAKLEDGNLVFNDNELLFKSDEEKFKCELELREMVQEILSDKLSSIDNFMKKNIYIFKIDEIKEQLDLLSNEEIESILFMIDIDSSEN